jgi:nucleoside-diphosphate-sugar epimerase
VELDCHVVALERPDSDYWRARDIEPKLEKITADLNTATETGALPEVDYVFHLAAAGVNVSTGTSLDLAQTNVLGTLRLLEWTRLQPVKRFVYCGSCFEYGEGSQLKEDELLCPTSEYAASKSAGWLFAESFRRRYDLPVVTLRPFTLFGPFEARHRLIPHTILAGLQGSELRLTGGEQTRDFVYIDDVVDAFLLAATCSGAVGQTLNVCTGRETPVRDLVTTILQLADSRAHAQFGVIPYRDSEMWRLSGNPDKAAEVIGFRAATPLEEALKATISWFRANALDLAEYRESGP